LFIETKKLSKKEQKAKEDAEFEAMMADLGTNKAGDAKNEE
jgi:hypothetical protein